MLRINEHDIEPAVYRHHKGNLYVVVELLTHMEKDDSMQKLTEPLVIYRDLEAPIEHINGKAQAAQHRYAKPLNDFKQKFSKV